MNYSHSTFIVFSYIVHDVYGVDVKTLGTICEKLVHNEPFANFWTLTVLSLLHCFHFLRCNWDYVKRAFGMVLHFVATCSTFVYLHAIYTVNEIRGVAVKLSEW